MDGLATGAAVVLFLSSERGVQDGAERGPARAHWLGAPRARRANTLTGCRSQRVRARSREQRQQVRPPASERERPYQGPSVSGDPTEEAACPLPGRASGGGVPAQRSWADAHVGWARPREGADRCPQSHGCKNPRWLRPMTPHCLPRGAGCTSPLAPCPSVCPSARPPIPPSLSLYIHVLTSTPFLSATYLSTSVFET